MTNSFASAWLNIMGLLNSKSPAVRADGAILAKINLQDTITQLKAVEDSLKQELRATASNVKVAQTQNAKTTLQHLLVRSRTKRMRLTQTHKKRLNMEQQLEALAMSELNNQVLSSMQKTSVALKSLGIQNSVENADEMMLDMQESQQDLSVLQDVLGQAIGPDVIDDDNLAEELEMLMSMDTTEVMFDLPFIENKMNDNTQPPVKTKETPKATSDTETSKEIQPVPERGSETAVEAEIT
tara:strand:- start:3422 stop:4141 length:720 start_codon:yes stop_codon:yes gene_type:complete